MKRFDYLRSSRNTVAVPSLARTAAALLAALCCLGIAASFWLPLWTPQPRSAHVRRVAATTHHRMRRPLFRVQPLAATRARPHRQRAQTPAPHPRLPHPRQIHERVLAIAVGEKPQAIVASRNGTRVVTTGDRIAHSRVAAITLAGIRLADGSRLLKARR